MRSRLKCSMDLKSCRGESTPGGRRRSMIGCRRIRWMRRTGDDMRRDRMSGRLCKNRLSPNTITQKRWFRGKLIPRATAGNWTDWGEETKVTRAIWHRSVEMFRHRSGTKFEDLAFIDSRTGKSLAQNSYHHEREVIPAKAMKQMLLDRKPYSVIAIHNHPSGA